MASSSPGPPALRRQLEAREIESRRDGAADQRPRAEAFGGLPGAGRRDCLRALASRKIGSERNALRRSAGLFARGDLEHQRRARVEVPQLGGIDAMPTRTLAAFQQKIDRGRGRARALDQALIAEGFAEM